MHSSSSVKGLVHEEPFGLRSPQVCERFRALGNITHHTTWCKTVNHQIFYLSRCICRALRQEVVYHIYHTKRRAT